MKPQYIHQLRKEAEEQAKQILGSEKLKKDNLESKNNVSKPYVSMLHSVFDVKDIDHCINNDLDIGYLYTQMGSKYNGDREETPPKQYYIPTGVPRGRPKKENNE